MGFRIRKAVLTFGALAAILSVNALIVGTPICHAEESSAAQPRVKLDLRGADLISAINMLKLQTDADFVIRESDKPYGRVTLSVKDVPLDEALKIMCESAGASITSKNGIYYIGPKDAIVLEDPARNPEKIKVDVTPEPVDPRLSFHVVKIPVINSRPSQLLRYFGLEQGWINSLEDRMVAQTMFEFKSGYQNQQAHAPQVLYNPYFAGMMMSPLPSVETLPPTVPTTDKQPNKSAVSNRAPGNATSEEAQFGGFGGNQGNYGGGGYGGNQGGFGNQGGYGNQGGFGNQGGNRQGGFGQGGFGQGGFGQGGQNAAALGLLPTGVDPPLALDTDNSLIVRGSDDGIRELKEIIRLLDVAPRQLQIKAELVQVSQNDAKTFGINWTLSRGSLQAGNTGGDPFATGDVYLNYASSNLMAQLRASVSEGKGKIVNSPMVTTTNNVPVQIQIGSQIPIITEQVVFVGTNQGVTVPQINVVNVLSGLQVIPRINGDDSITMVISPQISDVAQTISNPSGGTIPIIAQQSITVTRRIKNGETMVIGGLNRKNESANVRKVPILADLPLIGKLFESRTNSINDSELLIFVTATIIPDSPGGGGTVSAGGVTVGGATP